MGGALLAAGLADLVRARPGQELVWWVDRLRETGIRWWDFAASADPVPNGALIDEQQGFPQHVTVHNRGSLMRDHSTYWSNRDEFVAGIATRLAELDPALAADFGGHAERLAFARRRRRWRVGWLAGFWWLAGVAALATLTYERETWLPLIGDVMLRIAGLFGVDTASSPLPAGDLAHLLGSLAPRLASYLAAVVTWRVMDRAETARFLARRGPVAQVADYAFLLSVIALVLASAWAIAPPAVDRWLARASPAVWLVVLLGIGTAWWGTQQRLGVLEREDSLPSPPQEAQADRVGRTIVRLIVLASQAVGLVVVAAWLWNLVTR